MVKFTVNGIHPVVTSGTNVGKICAPISTVMAAVVAQMPALGVNVYVVVAELLIAGDQDPEMELVEVVGSVKFAPEQSGANWLKLGTTGSFTVTVIEYGRAHSLALGVKVYVKFPAVAVESIPGFHVPLIPLSDVVGNMTCSNTSFKQNGPSLGNVGVTRWLTVTFIVAAEAH